MLVLFLPCNSNAQPNATRPNILLVIADDWGWGHAGVLGDPVVKTPNFDRLSIEGALLRRAYCTSPSCTPSRAGLLTGQMFYRLESAAILGGVLDEKFAVYPEILKADGYVIGSQYKGLGPGDPKGGGRPYNAAGPLVKDFKTFIEEKPADKPFCFWFGSNNPHRKYDQTGLKGTVDASRIVMPPYLPDVPEVREDVADYYAEVQAFDRELGELLKVLEDKGILDQTLIVVTSDNGMPFPRAKLNLYDSGTRMPTAIRWGDVVQRGHVIEDFVNLTDLAPTFLEAAGLPVPEDMTGKSLMTILRSKKSGWIDPDRDSTVVGRERHGDSYYPCRALHTRDYLYIRNYHPFVSPGHTDAGPTATYYKKHLADEDFRHYRDLFEVRRPAEELYDNRVDPDQINNVSLNPAYAEIKERLSRKLDEYLELTNDPRTTDQSEIFGTYSDSRIKKQGGTEE